MGLNENDTEHTQQLVLSILSLTGTDYYLVII